MERSTPVCEISRKGVCSREEGGESDILIQGQVHQQEQVNWKHGCCWTTEQMTLWSESTTTRKEGKK